jgi:hypothetical protein
MGLRGERAGGQGVASTEGEQHLGAGRIADRGGDVGNIDLGAGVRHTPTVWREPCGRCRIVHTRS